MAAILNFGSILQLLAHPDVAGNVMVKFQKNRPVAFAPTRNLTQDAGQNPGVTKIPFPYELGIKIGQGHSCSIFTCIFQIGICISNIKITRPLHTAALVHL